MAGEAAAELSPTTDYFKQGGKNRIIFTDLDGDRATFGITHSFGDPRVAVVIEDDGVASVLLNRDQVRALIEWANRELLAQ